ncbi:hypothetical protein TIFTF001_030921 [Ficus carica]|uniref:Uncharacterized protein n=1 Tax=Ficus carica TaxID=3494 RepID=A0AA88J4F8_FICCA|nr:hypothetical protein TIFTF001_030921 [Ficus carica]
MDVSRIRKSSRKGRRMLWMPASSRSQVSERRRPPAAALSTNHPATAYQLVFSGTHPGFASGAIVVEGARRLARRSGLTAATEVRPVLDLDDRENPSLSSAAPPKHLPNSFKSRVFFGHLRDGMGGRRSRMLAPSSLWPRRVRSGSHHHRYSCSVFMESRRQ